MKFIAILAFFAAIPCFAHLELGEYRGVTEKGEACSFKVLTTGFAYDLAHPLNERATIEVQGTQLQLSHPSQIDIEQNHVGFDHDHLTGVQGTTYGGFAGVLTMSHAPGHHGPTVLTLVRHNYKNAADSSRATCSDLAHQ
ncbi:MAG: hypothetical protein HY074_01820 [Deltaproteobacteria bacterium]|nr:hypothetical protein [Deltaproteobacteria bacterium]